MPSLSINSKDLDSLGINLKDLLRAIAQTKSSSNEVIKIKKKKKKGKGKKRMTTGLSKVAGMNPFPSNQPKFTQYPQTGGGGHGFAPMTKIEVRTEPQLQQQSLLDGIKKETQQQLVLHQNQLTQQINNQNANINSTHEATKMLFIC